jgi:hypothetical protein
MAAWPAIGRCDPAPEARRHGEEVGGRGPGRARRSTGLQMPSKATPPRPAPAPRSGGGGGVAAAAGDLGRLPRHQAGAVRQRAAAGLRDWPRWGASKRKAFLFAQPSASLVGSAASTSSMSVCRGSVGSASKGWRKSKGFPFAPLRTHGTLARSRVAIREPSGRAVGRWGCQSTPRCLQVGEPAGLPAARRGCPSSPRCMRDTPPGGTRTPGHKASQAAFQAPGSAIADRGPR